VPVFVRKQGLQGASKIQSSPQCKARKNLVAPHYADKKFFTPRSSWDEMRIFNGSRYIDHRLKYRDTAFRRQTARGMKSAETGTTPNAIGLCFDICSGIYYAD